MFSDRSTPVCVVTHNIRAESVYDKDDNSIFLDENIAPFNHQFHPLFRPVKPEFIQVVEERIELDRTHGQLAINTVFQHWMEEVCEDREVGNGVSSFEKLSDRLNFGSPSRLIICQKCHFEMNFDVESHNICRRCKNNPTVYEDSKDGPYKNYRFPENVPNTVIVKEQEPIGVNPSGRKNLFELHKQLKEFWPPEVKSIPFYGDGLPAVSYERIKSDSIQCITHDVNIPIKDAKLLGKHCREECELDWPLKDLYVLSGMSHEEIAMNVIALTNSIPFGVLEMLSELGRHTKNSQLQAIKSKNLRTLNELNYIYTKATFIAVLIPYLNKCAKLKANPTVEGMYTYVQQSPNLPYQARFRSLLSLNLPCVIKRIGIRLNNANISNGGSALFFPAAFAFKMSFYRDYYHYKYLNGKFVSSEECLQPMPGNFEDFLGNLELKIEKDIKTRPKVKSYPVKHPRENVRFGTYREKYSHLTESLTENDTHEGGDFIQENALGRVIPFLKRGKIFSRQIFAEAVRACQNFQNKCDKRKPDVKRKRPKYQNEIQSVTALILLRNEDAEEKEDLGDIHEDIMKVDQIGKENYREFFKKRITGTSTGSIRLKPLFVTKEAYNDYEKLENQPKSVIAEKIKDLILKIDFEDPQEKMYFENKSTRTDTRKNELIELHTELTSMVVLDSESHLSSIPSPSSP